MRSWNRNFLLLLALVLTAAGCDHGGEPLGPASDKAAAYAPTGDPAADDGVVINEYRVAYTGRSDGDGTTSFHWNVAGTGQGHVLDYFLIEVPECAGQPLSWAPVEDGRLVYNRLFGIYGVKWTRRISPLDLEGQVYSVTYAGNLGEGPVQALVNGSEPTVAGEITGPSCQEYIIEGTIFVDSDADGFLNPTLESGLGDVVVEVIDADGDVDTVRAAADGTYRFPVYAGTYTVRIDTLGYEDAFNPQLAGSFLATTPLEREVTLGPDAAELDFGFTVNADKVARELEDDVVPTVGEGATFWKQQLLVADYLETRFEDPPQFKKYYGPETMHAFLDVIRHLYLVDPYVFDPQDELMEAYALLRTHPTTDVEELRKELLISELNFASDQGIVGPQSVIYGPLIAWGEGILAGALQQDGAATPLDKAGNPVIDALRIFRALNTGGGADIDD